MSGDIGASLSAGYPNSSWPFNRHEESSHTSILSTPSKQHDVQQVTYIDTLTNAPSTMHTQAAHVLTCDQPATLDRQFGSKNNPGTTPPSSVVPAAAVICLLKAVSPSESSRRQPEFAKPAPPLLASFRRFVPPFKALPPLRLSLFLLLLLLLSRFFMPVMASIFRSVTLVWPLVLLLPVSFLAIS